MRGHRSPQDIYASHLLSERGYPLWVPEPDSLLLDLERPGGLAIGDVGVVHPEGGYFDVLFNICLPLEHPFHRAVGVPQGFIPIKLKDEDIEITLNTELSYIKSTSVANVEASITRTQAGSDSGVLEFACRLDPKEGALLILPEGADRHVLRNKSCFLDHMVQHGADWYRFARERRGWIIGLDALYVITGFHKTKSWSLGAYDDITTASGLPAKFRATQIGGDDINVRSAYTWQTAHPSNRRIGPVRNDGATRNQAVFICGFKVALRGVARGMGICGVLPGLCGLVSGNFWRRKTRVNTRKTASDPVEQASKTVLRRAAIEIRRFPEVSRVFHPCDVINEYLLQQEPSASIAISHDSDWIALLENNLLEPDELVQEECLRKALARTCISRSQGGVVYLERKSASDAFSVAEAGGSLSIFLRRFRRLLVPVISRFKHQAPEDDRSRSVNIPEPLPGTETHGRGPVSTIVQAPLWEDAEDIQTRSSEQTLGGSVLPEGNVIAIRSKLPRTRATVKEDLAGSSGGPPLVTQGSPRKNGAVIDDIPDPSFELLPVAREKLPRKQISPEDMSGPSIEPRPVRQPRLRKRPASTIVDPARSEMMKTPSLDE